MSRDSWFTRLLRSRHSHELPVADGEPEVYELGARRFVMVGPDMPAEQDAYVIDAREKAGLVELEMAAGETADAFARRIMARIMRDGAVFDLLGGLLVPEGQAAEWTPETGAATAAHLRRLTGVDRLKVTQILAGTMAVFFAEGLSSVLISPSSSESPQDSPATPASAYDEAGRVLAWVPGTDAGGMPSASSPATTSIGLSG